MATQLKLIEGGREEAPSRKADKVHEIFEYWRAVLEKPTSQLGPKRRKSILSALDIGYTVDDLRLACVGCKYDSWSNGNNQTGLSYTGIEFICRDETTIERYIEKGHEYMRRSQAKDVRAAEKVKDDAARAPMPDYVRAKLDALFSKHKKEGT